MKKALITGITGQDGAYLAEFLLVNETLQALLQRGGSPASLYAQAGDFALNYLHDEDLASSMFVKAIERNPSDKEYAHKIIGVLMNEGANQKANAVIDKVAQLGLIERPREAAPPVD